MNEHLTALLAAFDDRLRGEPAARDSLPNTSEAVASDATELEDLQDCVQILESRWPRTTREDPVRLDQAPPGDLSATGPQTRPEKPILKIGRFEIQRVLGEGGFGIVYLAHDPALHRVVALKVPRLHAVAGTRTWERFRREAHAAATLDHAHIVPTFEAGEAGAVCYIAAAYCEGPNLAQWLKQQTTPVGPRLAATIVARLAEAVQYSHSRGILHGDLKPSNVMLPPTTAIQSSHDNELPFIPRLTDFGLAKRLNEEFEESAASALLGTPSYMAPEQLEDTLGKVGPGTDVYALGAMLYELLTGRPPFQGINVVDIIDEVRHSEPISPRRLRREIPRDLEIICLKCLEKRPSRRYGTAGDLTGDLQRYLHGEPLRARRPSAIYSAIKWMRRRPAKALAIVVSALALLIIVSGGWYYNWHLASALQIAEQLRTEAVDREERLRVQMYAADMRLAWKAWEAGDTEETLLHLNAYHSKTGENDLRGFEWHLLRGSSQAEVRTLHGHAAPILTVDVSPDDAFLASGDRNGVVRIWDGATGQELRSIQYSTQEVTCVRFSPDGKTLATAGQDRSVRLWNVKDWSECGCLSGHALTVTAVSWSPDSRLLASSGRDNHVLIWDTATASQVKSLTEQTDVVRTLAWSPDGKLLAAAVRDEGLRLWETGTWKLLTKQPFVGTSGILALAFSPDSKLLASAGYGGNLLIHDLAARKAVAEVDLPNTVWSLSFSPDGRLLMAGRGDGLVNLWETQSTSAGIAELRTLQAGTGAVRDVAFDSTGRYVVTAMEQDRALQVRSTSDLAVCRPYHFTPACRDIVGQATHALLMDTTGTLKLSSMLPGKNDSPNVQLSAINNAVFFAQGEWIACGVNNGITIHDTTMLAVSSSLDAGEPILSVAVSPDGQRISGSTKSGAIWLWDVGSRSSCGKLEGHKSSAVHTAFSPNNKLLASASSEEQQILLWDAQTGRRLGEVQAVQGVTALAFSPDSRTLAVAALDHIVMLWDVSSSRAKQGVLRGHTDAVRSVAFSPDGQTIATAGDDGTARLWHAATHQELCILTRRSRPLLWMRFLSPRQLAIGTASSGTGPLDSNDVLVFDTGKQLYPSDD